MTWDFTAYGFAGNRIHHILVRLFAFAVEVCAVIIEDRCVPLCNRTARFLTYARILDPASKFATWGRLSSYYEQPSFDYQHILRFMDLLADNYDGYLAWLYKLTDCVTMKALPPMLLNLRML